jgi:hypothetical protein
MSLQLPFGIRVLNQLPVENKYLNGSVPYTGTTQANTLIPIGIRHVGLTVNINNVEYWYENGIDDIDLVIKSSDSGGTITGATNGLTVVGKDIELGGTLIKDTTIIGASNSLNLGESNSRLNGLNIRTAAGGFFAESNGGGFVFREIDGGGFFVDSRQSGGITLSDRDGGGILLSDGASAGSTAAGGINIASGRSGVSGNNIVIETISESNSNITLTPATINLTTVQGTDEASGIVLSSKYEGEENRFELGYGNGGVFSNIDTNKRGIRYTGFGETNINTEGNVDYSNLAFNSLVPKKYVDDAISNIDLSNNDYLIVTGSTILDSIDDNIIIVDSSVSVITVTLTTTPVDKRTFRIKDIGNALINNIIIDGNSRNIDGQSQAIIDTNYGLIEVKFIDDLDEWIITSFVN